MAHIDQPKWISFWRLHFGHQGVLRPKIFKRARDWQGLPSAPPFPNGDGVPRIKFNCKNLNFCLKFSVWAPITSMLVGISSPNFYSRRESRDDLWSTNKKVIARILTHPKCSYAVCWRKSIRHVVLGYSFWSRLLALLREEFRISKLTLHSDLRRRAALRRDLPCPSSMKYILMNKDVY